MLVTNKKFKSDSPVYIIAEIGINHNGNLNTACKLIKLAAESGANAVKLQSYKTEKRVPKTSPLFDLLKQCEFNHKETEILFDVARNENVEIFSTPFDNESLGLLEDVGCEMYKIASFDSGNISLLNEVKSTQKPLIISTGMSTTNEVNNIINSIGANNELVLLHCVSSYPTNIHDSDLKTIFTLKNLYDGIVGYSDHTIGINASKYSVFCGAKVIEKHFTYNNDADGPDHKLSATPDTLKKLVSAVRDAEIILGEGKLRVRENELDTLPFKRNG